MISCLCTQTHEVSFRHQVHPITILATLWHPRYLLRHTSTEAAIRSSTASLPEKSWSQWIESNDTLEAGMIKKWHQQKGDTTIWISVLSQWWCFSLSFKTWRPVSEFIMTIVYYSRVLNIGCLVHIVRTWYLARTFGHVTLVTSRSSVHPYLLHD